MSHTPSPAIRGQHQRSVQRAALIQSVVAAAQEYVRGGELLSVLRDAVLALDRHDAPC